MCIGINKFYMRIGIFTLALHTNYGGILQAFALQTVLERMGHEVIVFNKHLPAPKASLFIIIKRLMLKIFGRDVVVFEEKKKTREAPIVNKTVCEFRTKYINEVFIDELSEIKKYSIDCIIVGSDQIWRSKYFKEQWSEHIENAFLSFTKDWHLKRISYAASFGVDEWTFDTQETEKILSAIKMFDAISVREESGIKLLKQKNIESTVVLDPTLLLTQEDYLKLILNAQIPKSKGNMLVYLLDPNKSQKQLIKSIENDTSLTPFFVNNNGLSATAPVENRVLPAVESWLRGFYDAECVITDSFHACVFSIIFNKPFVVFGNKDRGLSRFESLLSQFGLSACLLNEYSSKEDVISLLFPSNNKTELSYSPQEILRNKIEYSMKYLDDALQS